MPWDLQFNWKGLKDVRNAIKQGGKERRDTNSSLEHSHNNVECNYCHKKGHFKTNCPVLAAKQSNHAVKSNSDADKKNKPKHWTRIPPSDSESSIKTVMMEGKNITFKWCKYCRRWRSGQKAHLTDEHKKGEHQSQKITTIISKIRRVELILDSFLVKLTWMRTMSFSKASLTKMRFFVVVFSKCIIHFILQIMIHPTTMRNKQFMMKMTATKKYTKEKKMKPQPNVFSRSTQKSSPGGAKGTYTTAERPTSP